MGQVSIWAVCPGFRKEKKKRHYKKVQVHLEILAYAQKLFIYLPKFFCVILYIRDEIEFLVFNNLSVFQKMDTSFCVAQEHLLKRIY